LHCTTRDHNRLSLQSILWGAKALGIHSVLAATGDYVALDLAHRISAVNDLDVFELITLARATPLRTGAVLDPRSGAGGLRHEIRRLKRKVAAGAQFIVTQPVFDRSGAEKLRAATRDLNVPIVLGILPLRSARHAEFLHHSVSGISVPDAICDRMRTARDPVAEGLALARDTLAVARLLFEGACIMPAFGRFEGLADLLS
jgi:homocysteine S-methyltransferase